MKNILYIGNRLSKTGKNPTGIEVLGPLLETGGYEVRYASSKPAKPMRMLDMIWCTLKSTRWADVVLIDTYSTSNFWYAFIISQLCRFLGLEYIPILHGGNLPSRLVSSPRMSKMIFGNAKIGVAPSRYLYDSFRQAGFRIDHVPNPVDTDAFVHKTREFVTPRLIWVRSLMPLYNPMMALETLLHLKADFPDANLTMVGPDHGLLTELKDFADAYGLNVTFAGRLSKADWARRAAQCDIFLNTAQVDNAPFSVIEALALGLFVVSTNVGGIPFLVKDGSEALLVPSDDSQAMASAVRRILTENSLRKTLAGNSRTVVSNSSSEAVLARWRKILG